jgi:DNA-binding SARP family transcriptional activator
LLLVLVTAGSAAAQQNAAKPLLDACSAELRRYCPRAPAERRAATECLRQYYLDLSIPCRTGLNRARAASGQPS